VYIIFKKAYYFIYFLKRLLIISPSPPLYRRIQISTFFTSKFAFYFLLVTLFHQSFFYFNLSSLLWKLFLSLMKSDRIAKWNTTKKYYFASFCKWQRKRKGGVSFSLIGFFRNLVLKLWYILNLTAHWKSDLYHITNI